MSGSPVIALFLVVLGITGGSTYSGSITLELNHALTPEIDAFTNRGSILLSQTFDSDVSTYQQSISSNDRALLKSLADTNNLYRLNVTIINSENGRQSFLTSSRLEKSCSMSPDSLADQLLLTLDNFGSVVGVRHIIENTDASECNRFVNLNDIRHFETTVAIRQIENAPIPDTATFIQKMERERESREHGEVKDNRGIFAKYWMYIVPVVIFVIISGVANPDGGAADAVAGR